ncbi:hypothetical protein AHAS_Ahas12G0219400 [Arachis hypogaea]
MHGGPVLAQQDGQAVSEPGPVIDDPIPEFSPIDSDMSIEYLFTQSSNPFAIESIGTSVTAVGQPSAVEQISPNGTTSVGGGSDGSPQCTPEVIIISDDEDTEEIEIEDLTSEDDEDPEMDIEIVDLTSDND